MKRTSPKTFRFSLEELANFICQYTQDGKRKTDRDVVTWFRWFEKKCGLSTSFIIGGPSSRKKKWVVWVIEYSGDNGKTWQPHEDSIIGFGVKELADNACAKRQKKYGIRDTLYRVTKYEAVK